MTGLTGMFVTTVSGTTVPVPVSSLSAVRMGAEVTVLTMIGQSDVVELKDHTGIPLMNVTKEATSDFAVVTTMCGMTAPGTVHSFCA